MPILTEDPRRLTHPHNLSFPAVISPTPTRISPAPSRVPPRIETWRGRKRSRSPSTSPAGSPERTWRTWSGTQTLNKEPMVMERQLLVRDDLVASGQQQQGQRGPFLAHHQGFQDYAVRSGVQLVLPTDETIAHPSAQTLENPDASESIINHQHGPLSKRKASIHSASSIHQDPQTHADAPKIKRPRFKGSYEHPSSAGEITSEDSYTLMNQEVPVWDIRRSAENSRESAEGASVRLSIGKGDWADLEEYREGDMSEDLENGYYVSSNMLLHDLVSLRDPTFAEVESLCFPDM
ncbi:hypothetical protein QFC20_004437 [Naganishia adeliensis]|uniref:Uncharacterized protein n=1 Tax=Naganishia adeliensis TaxID=92952 RepID=A0ACC2W2A5_9TREE|nr:hypothetical protein QFC20_004437 [Naganishia adeliensis]